MNQKELKEKLRYIPENKYFYQRYNGIINKYIDTGDYYISCETGMSCASGSCLLGKVKDNLIDLIEVGDYVNGRLVLQVDYKNKNVCLLIPFADTKANTNIMWYGYEQIKTILTKEQYEANCYKVGGEDE